MTNTEKHLKRAEVPEASTWDLTAIFPTDAAFEKELDELAGAVPLHMLPAVDIRSVSLSYSNSGYRLFCRIRLH